MNARVAPQLAERRQIAFDERVVPAPHREYGYVDLIQVNAGTEGLPERIVAGMIESILKHVTPLACARKIRPAQRQRADIAIELRHGKTRCTKIFRHPKKAVAKLEGAA